jgi:hypothetical protein
MELVIIFQESPIYLLVELVPLQWLPCLLIDLAIIHEHLVVNCPTTNLSLCGSLLNIRLDVQFGVFFSYK